MTTGRILSFLPNTIKVCFLAVIFQLGAMVLLKGHCQYLGFFLKNVNGMIKLETLFHYYQCSNQFRQGFSVGETLMKKKIFTVSKYRSTDYFLSTRLVYTGGICQVPSDHLDCHQQWDELTEVPAGKML